MRQFHAAPADFAPVKAAAAARDAAPKRPRRFSSIPLIVLPPIVSVSFELRLLVRPKAAAAVELYDLAKERRLYGDCTAECEAC